MKRIHKDHYVARYQKHLGLKGFLVFLFLTLGLPGVIAQNPLEMTLDMGVNLPRTTRDNLSNSPYLPGFNTSLEIAYHWRWLGLGAQLSYFNINNQDYTVTNNFGTHQSTSKATDFRGEKSQIVSVSFPLYFHVYNSEKLRISPFIGLDGAYFRKSAYTWEIDNLGTREEIEVELGTTDLLGLKVGFDITHKLSKKLALKYGIQRSYLTNFYSDTVVLYDFSIGVAYTILQNVSTN
ncbi:autotransporter outer membrane beta-barrel domain-containing protein [Portibacter lacus]|nr:autotransporter outer membrane beta-barrel domain-containing protein [Portibacter lacus]